MASSKARPVCTLCGTGPLPIIRQLCIKLCSAALQVLPAVLSLKQWHLLIPCTWLLA